MAEIGSLNRIHPTTGGKATTVMILGILCFFFLPTGPFAWALGRRELRAIAAGESPIDGETKARFGMVVGMIQSIAFALAIAVLLLLAGSSR